ncbi:MAG TPA: nitroreductase family deazaflavin-dependent oxidoreductase [Solirubrobacteraceae bacterium]|jgi:deazaflavin-dependent oxidoreductase (nitroreductase family)|nr:nitroreductase family deazaflavin-dependent oxidoreductase [Solirubrobacteraceae bacterium]
MTPPSSPAAPPRAHSLLARALKLPTALYAADLGWLLGHRFLALHHRGRRSGRMYTTVLEVVRWRPDSSEAVVVSGFGPRSQWYRNVLAGGAAEIRIGRRRFTPEVRALTAQEASAVLADYERRNRIAAPLVRAVLGRLAGMRYDGSSAARAQLVEAIPFIAFTPRPPAAPRPAEADRVSGSSAPRRP